MKKLPALAKNKKTSKNADFKRIYRIYRACLREQRKAIVLQKKACAKYASLKEKKTADKEKLRAAKCACKMAKNYTAMWKRLVKASLKHVLKWADIYGKCKEKAAPKKSKAKKKTAKISKKSTKTKVVKLKAASKKTAKKVKLKVKKAAAPKKATKPVVKKAAPKKTAKPKVKKIPAKKAPVKKAVPVIKIAKPIVIKAAPPKRKAAPKPAVKKPVPKKPVAKKAPARKPGQKDNLKRIEGVGPKIEGLMNAAGITTFNQVTRSSITRLQGILDKAGPHFKFADPATWPQQAKLAHAGKWVELKKWQGELKGGKQVK